MKATQLLSEFDRITEAPDATPRIRRLILDLAVRGRLVEQDSGDEAASELLERVQAEKVRLVEAGEIGKQAPLVPRAEDGPFKLPNTWAWSRLAEIGFLSPRNSAEDELRASFVPMPLISSEYGVAHKHDVRLWGEIKKGYTHFAEGDVALAKITPCFENGKSTVFRDLTGGIGAGTTELHVVRPALVSAEYILIFLKSSHFIGGGVPRMTGTAGQKRVPAEYFAYSPFPLPPLAEQHRIVAKVGELMSLCDRLEATQADRETRRHRLAGGSLQRLNQPANSLAFREYARFHIRILERLTTQPEQVKQLRQTILRLAVRGHLVRQDPNDEPVSDLIRQIQELKARLAAENDLRGRTSVAPRATDFGPYEIPSSWKWVPFGDLMISRDGERVPLSKDERNGRAKLYDYYGASGVIDKVDHYLFDKPLLLVGEDGANLVNRSTPIAFVARGKYWVNNHAHVLDGISEGFLRFIELQINATDLKPYVTGTAQPKMNQAMMNSIPMAVPPMAEQSRIVTKVDEILGLCERLEVHLTVCQTASRAFLEGAVHQVLAQTA